MKIIISLSRYDRDITPNLMTMQDRILWDSLGECERFDLANERVKLNQIRLLRRERKTKVPGEKNFSAPSFEPTLNPSTHDAESGN